MRNVAFNFGDQISIGALVKGKPNREVHRCWSDLEALHGSESIPRNALRLIVGKCGGDCRACDHRYLMAVAAPKNRGRRL